MPPRELLNLDRGEQPVKGRDRWTRTISLYHGCSHQNGRAHISTANLEVIHAMHSDALILRRSPFVRLVEDQDGTLVVNEQDIRTAYI